LNVICAELRQEDATKAIVNLVVDDWKDRERSRRRAGSAG
jgi:hypothetical protein